MAGSFGPSRIQRPDAAARLDEFANALAAVPWIAERIAAGQQFNAYARANADAAFEDDEYEEDDDETEFAVCIGPIGDARFLFYITGRDRAALVEAALKVATEALRERKP